MTPLPTSAPEGPSATVRLRAFAVHVLTAFGGGVALMALLEAVREHWSAMFGWLGFALVIDAIDGPIARRFKVASVLPDWSGDVLDLVVDFVTYVFVPAYAVAASGLLLPIAAPVIGIAIVVTGALYFADRRMKAEDNHFRGFPALWNAAAFYLFLLKPAPFLGSVVMGLLVLLTFVPIRVIHPVRVKRLRGVNLGLIALWAALAIYSIRRDFDVSMMVSAALCVIAAYVLGADLLFRMAKRLTA